MRLFISAGEPSGDLHGANLSRALLERYPGVDLLGFGGDRMAEAGCRIVYPLCDYAVVGVGAAVRAVPTFYRILKLARETFRRERPDGLVLIDYPGFHWWLAGAARAEAIPVTYFVPPQLWAWAGWRTHKMRRLVDQVLCSLPFEETWFHQRRVPARYIGHPYFDELARQRLDSAFVAGQRAQPGTVVGILPGSRHSELNGNIASFAEAAKIIHAKRPEVRFLVACLKPAHADLIRNKLAGLAVPLEVHAGRTAEIIHLAHSCMSVSGSVSLELLHRARPTSIIYHASALVSLLGKFLMKAKYITLVNLLANDLLYPEHVYTRGTVGREMAGEILHWLEDRAAYEDLCGQLEALKARVALPGACARAAVAIAELALDRPQRWAA
jgi:lipid-A-disaccharide synthase